MDEDRETPRSHKSSSSPNSAQLEASRSVMPPLSPLPTRGGPTYAADRGGGGGGGGGDTSDLSRAILAVSGEDSLAKMNYVARFLHSMPGGGGGGGGGASNSRDYSADLARREKYASPNWRNAVAATEKSDVRGGREFAVDDGGFSMEGSRDDLGRARIPVDNTYYISRSPLRTVGNNSSKPGGVQSETMDGRSDIDGEVHGERRHHHLHHHHHQFQNFFKSHATGYDLDMLDQAESRYLQHHHQQQHHSPYAKKFGALLQPPSMSLEDNPLAAMVQKFAVSGNGEYSASPLKTVGPPVGASSSSSSLYPEQRGLLPKKRRFRSDMIFPTSSMSYGLPPSLHGSAGGTMAAMGGVAKGPGHPDVFICHICSFVATSNEDFKAHMSIHYDYQCPQCTYSSRTEGRLKRHIKDFHGASDSTAGGDEENPDGRTAPKTNQPKKFKCRQCHFISYSREEHWRHIKVHIKKEKQLKCIHCPFVTEFKHHLEYHIRNHNNSKPYKCGKCNYTCVNKSMLNSHMKSHTNVYQFRCASCKYATKYSHSLKLHLVNKKHVPAVVLNPDGSLPTDGSGSFELISKRGPPRGPRGPRKSKSMSGDAASPPALLPIFPTNSSPIMSLGGQGNEYPWIPVQNGKQPLNGVAIPGALPPLKAALLSTAGTIPNQSLGYPLNILSQLSSSITPPAVSYPSDRMDAVGYTSDRMDAVGYHLDRMDAPVAAASVPCGFCPAAFSSLVLLADHVKMEHAQKLGGFGVKLEARSPTPEPGTLSYPDHASVCEKKLYAEDAICHVTVSNSKPETAVFSSRNVGQPSPNRGEVEIDAKKDSVTETSEVPLDLSSKNFDDVKRSAVKRTAFDAEEEDTSSTVSLSVAAVSRKRSRKGKACKLDELSLKLQDHWKEEDGLLEGSESSSLDDECLSGFTASGCGGAGRETERKFSEVGCGTTSSPPPPPPPPATANLNDSGSWSWRKESSPQYSDADSSDQHCREKKNRAETHRGQRTLRQNELSDQEPVSDNSNGSEGFDTSHAKPSNTAAAAARKPADNGYYTCNYCDMGFRDNVTHFLHMGYHTYDDPFKCNKCGHRSSDAVDFFVHMARVAHTQ